MGLDRSFLAMLNVPIIVTPFLGEDKWGNTSYGEPFNAKAYQSPETESFGRDDNQNRQEGVRVIRSELITDALGIKLRDRITLGDGTIMYVEDVTTNKDEFGIDLFQNVTVQTEERG